MLVNMEKDYPEVRQIFDNVKENYSLFTFYQAIKNRQSN